MQITLLSCTEQMRENPCHEISSSQSYLSSAKSPAKLTRCNYIPQESTNYLVFEQCHTLEQIKNLLIPFVPDEIC